MMTFDAFGQKQSLKEQLIGTWTLLSWEQKKGDGTKVERYGTSPNGIAFFDAGGRYIITVMRSDRVARRVDIGIFALPPLLQASGHDQFVSPRP
jgi:hypothetical protein